MRSQTIAVLDQNLFANPMFSRSTAIPDQSHSAHSSLREKILEHTFLASLLKALWCQGVRSIDILRTEVDSGGFDLVLCCDDVIRFVQLKSSHRDASTAKVSINVKLQGKPSGCVIWILFDQATLELGPYLWFGNEPGTAMPDLGNKVAKHTKGDSRGEKRPRPALRDIARGRFTELESIDEVVARLFALAWRREFRPIVQRLTEGI